MWNLLRQKRHRMEHFSAKAVITQLQEKATWINTSRWFIRQTTPFINVPQLGASSKTRTNITWNLILKQSTKESGLIVVFASTRLRTRKVWGNTLKQDTPPLAWPCDLCHFKGYDKPELRSHSKVKHMMWAVFRGNQCYKKEYMPTFYSVCHIFFNKKPVHIPCFFAFWIRFSAVYCG